MLVRWSGGTRFSAFLRTRGNSLKTVGLYVVGAMQLGVMYAEFPRLSLPDGLELLLFTVLTPLYITLIMTS